MTLDWEEDALSFASFIQPNNNDNTTPMMIKTYHVSNPSFEFHSERMLSVNSASDVTPMNGSIMPSFNHKGSSGNKRCLKENNGRKSANISPKRVSFQEDVFKSKRSVSSPLPDVRGDLKEKKSKGDVKKRKGFIGSILLVCRECRAVEPSKRVGVHVVG